MAQETAKKTSLKPIGNRVVAQRTEQEETTKGGIILPDSAKQKQETAVVLAVDLIKLVFERVIANRLA